MSPAANYRAIAVLTVALLTSVAGASFGQSGVQYVYDDLGRLTAVIDASGNAAAYQYDAVGNILAIIRYTSSQASILGFNPARGPVGTAVTINGTGFSATVGQNSVRFNGVSAAITYATANRLVATVPAGATTGPIGVTSPAGSATSTAPFTVTTSTAAPTITSFAPASGVAGNAIAVTGTNFDLIPANDKVKLNSNRTAVGSATSTLIGTTVPVATASGRISVQTPTGAATSSQDFYVPFGAHVAADIGSTGRVAVGAPHGVSLAAGKIGLLLFDTVGGQTATIQFSSSTFSSCTAYLFSPANTQLATGVCSTLLTPTYLPTTGTYTIGIEGASAGSLTAALTVNPAALPLPARPADSVMDYPNPLSVKLAGLFLMNEGSGTVDKNVADLLTAAFSGASLPTWNATDPSVAFGGGASLNSFLDAGTDSNFGRLQVGKMTVLARVYVNVASGGGVAAAGVCEKNDGNTIDSGFVFGWNANGALKLTVEKNGTNMRVSTANGLVTPGQWIQVAFTWDGTVATAAAAHLFANGVEQPKASANDGAGTVGYANSTNRPFRIGNASFDFAGSLNGRMAYLAVYGDRMLTPAEMSQLDVQLPTNATDTIGPITPNGSPVAVTTTLPGQGAQFTFNGSLEQQATVQVSGNTIGSVTVSLIGPDGVAISTQSSSATTFSVPSGALFAAALHRVYVHANGPTSGSITVALTTSGGIGTIPSRPPGSTIDSASPLSTSLVGLFVMNEGTGTTDKNLVTGQTAAFSGTSLPTWNTANPSVVLNGGASLNSYLDAGTDLTFDRLPTSQTTVVAKVYVTTLAAAGVCEKSDGNTIDSGLVFGWGSTGALKLTVEKSSTDMRVSTAGSAVSSGQWIQVAFTWDGTLGTASSSHLFVNGIEMAKTTSADGSGTVGYANATNRPFRIGNASFDFAGSLNGRMAYLAVYRGRILTPTELSQLDAHLPIH